MDAPDVRPTGTGGLRLNKGNRDPCLYVFRRATYAVCEVAERALELLPLLRRKVHLVFLIVHAVHPRVQPRGGLAEVSAGQLSPRHGEQQVVELVLYFGAAAADFKTCECHMYCFFVKPPRRLSAGAGCD